LDDGHSLGLLFGLLFLFMVGSAFFSASETGIMTSNRYRLKHQAKLGNKSAQRILKLLQQPDRLIGVILIGNNTVNNLAAVVATLIGLQVFGDIGASIAAGVLTFVMLVFCEVGPKTYAASHPERIANFTSPVLLVLLKIIYPLVWLLNKITNVYFN
jgi:Mg2+/Co2+ transporter CorB